MLLFVLRLSAEEINYTKTMHDPRKHTTVTPPQRPPRPQLPRVVRRVDATVALCVGEN